MKIEVFHFNLIVQDSIMSSRSKRFSGGLFRASKIPARSRRGVYQTVFSFQSGDVVSPDAKSEPGSSTQRGGKK
jgi:hypothetical protein